MHESLKSPFYSVILTTSFLYWINRFKKTKNKNEIPYFQNFTWFQLQVFKLCMKCVFLCSRRFLYWIKFCRCDFLWKWLSFHTDINFSLISILRKFVSYREKLPKYFFKSQNLDNFKSALYQYQRGMPVTIITTPSRVVSQYLYGW